MPFVGANIAKAEGKRSNLFEDFAEAHLILAR